MADQRHNRSWLKRLGSGLMWPILSLAATIRELGDIVKQVAGWMLGPLRGGRRNRDFDRAGRPASNRGRRAGSTAAFRRGERDRKREIRNAERERKRLSRLGSKAANEYREAAANRATDCSRGEVVNHLARVNAKTRENSSPRADDSKPLDQKSSDG